MDYPWYQVLENDQNLRQGDFIPECPILVPPRELTQGAEPEIDVQLIDSIVLTQSCDLENNKAEIVLVCAYYDLSTFIGSWPEDQTRGRGKKKVIDNLRKGFLPSYHLLEKENPISGFEDYKVVDFKNVYGIHLEALQRIIGNLEKRVRLLPPYREHLSQAFARYFMRVGLPQDIRVEGY